MYQNAPPHYNQSYASPSPQQQYGGGGYYGNNDNMQEHPPGYPNPNNYAAPSPVNSAYQRANAAMAGTPPTQRGVSPGPPNNNPAGGGASGLIRLTLHKPMGIVFEPMTDPHNPSQQRGVRICDLPRTGAAAMSQKLEVGDELLSINDKTMSRLTFDEIMDFIIAADKERVDLLFRRPGKDRFKGSAGGEPVASPVSPTGIGGVGSNSNSVKWIDEKGDMAGKLTKEVGGESERERDDRQDGHRGGGDDRRGPQDDPSVDDTYTDGYTVESQSQYTMETYEEDRRRGGGRGGGGGGDSRYSDYEDDRKGRRDDRRDDRRGGRGDRHDKRKSSGDPMASSGFLDLLIDTLCTSVMGRDARDSIYGDRGDNGKQAGGRDARGKGYDDDEDDFTVDDGTYATYDELPPANDRRDRRNAGGDRRHRSHHQSHHRPKDVPEEESLATEGEQTLTDAEDDGTQTLESKEVVRPTQKQQLPIQDHLKPMSQGTDKRGNWEPLNKSASKHSTKSNDQNDPIMNLTSQQDENNMAVEDDRQDNMGHQFHGGRAQDLPQHQQHRPPSYDPMAAPDPPTKVPSNSVSIQQQLEQQYHPQAIVDHQMDHAGEQESTLTSGIGLPVKELEYDDRVDYAADVSVMESLGGPSLLVERARHENAVSHGHDRASFENLDRQDPELAALVAAHGREFAAGPGMTREETAFRDPYKFYEHAVCALLRENEPEKVRLLSKLMAKYRGRERHLINKLSARYDKDKGRPRDGGGGGGSGGGSGGHEQAVAASGSGAGDAKSRTSESSNNNPSLANKQSMSGMEKIHEGEDEEAGSSVLNDPSRANMAAIETAKEKMESSKEVANSKSSPPPPAVAQDAGGGALKAKSTNEDGWPPAMADPWGTGGGGAAVPGDRDDARPLSHIREDEDPPAVLSDAGSYSDGSGSSYTPESEGVDGTSPAIIAQVSELLNYVYGKTSVAGQIDRVSTIMRAYEGREAVLLELLETKALIKANADSNRDAGDLPVSLRNAPGLNGGAAGPQAGAEGGGDAAGAAGDPKKPMRMTPQTPVSVLTAPTVEGYPAGQASPASANSPKGVSSPSNATLTTMNTATTGTTTASKKKKKKIFGGFFGGKKKDKKGNFPSADSSKLAPAKGKSKRMGRKGQPLNEDDRSI